MTWPILLAAAVLLSLERIAYLWIWHKPKAFRRCCERPLLKPLGGPVNALRMLFYVFKVLQGAVFVGWCYFFGGGELLPSLQNIWAIAVGLVLLALGQLLNCSVFSLLGKNGVFYGNRFGYRIEWREEFPFSIFEHPQYAGAMLSIWGFFLIMRFPHDDWYWLPLLEAIYYGIGAYFERDPGESDQPVSSRTPSRD